MRDAGRGVALGARLCVGACLLALSVGCATPSRWLSESGNSESLPGSGRVLRPELGPEYDVLVAEVAAREGHFDLAQAAFERAAQADPGSAHLQYRLAQLAAQADRIGPSILFAERGFALNPDDIDGRLFLARLYLVDRRKSEVPDVLRGDDGMPVSSEAALLLYQVLLEQGRLQDALQTAKQLRAAEPEFLGAAMAVAAAYERMGRFADAEQALRDALAQHPNRIVIYSRLARMRRSQGDREGEIALYREVLEERPGHYGTLVSLGEAQIAQNKIDQAILTYAQLAALFPDDLQILRRLASLEFGSGRYEEAADRLRRAIRRHPSHHEFSYSLGQVLRALGRSEEALEVFDSIPRSHPLYVEARMQMAIYFEDTDQFELALNEIEGLRSLRAERSLDFQAASLRARTGDFDGGVAMLEAMLAENPADVEALYQLGVLYGINKDIDQSLLYMNQVLEYNPENAQALNYVGYTWVERGENLDRAEQLIEQAVRLSPRDGYIADSLGWVYYMRARPLIDGARRSEGLEFLEKAIVQLVLAMELTGGDPVVSEHLGDVYFLMDERQRALHYYEEADAMSPRLDEQPLLKEKIESLRQELGSAGDASEDRKFR
ncbi:MAG TPA: tetratricopeptide repeat protein [Myxococcales bacterium]|nr:tetratricopeptide repeat protein [Myxococcales bacterium]